MNNSKDIIEFLSKNTTVQFLESAQKFCSLIERDDLSLEEFLSKVHLSLVELYSTGFKLEIISLKYSFEYTPERLNSEKRKELNSSKISDLGKDSFYWEIFDPTYHEIDGKPENGWKISDKEPSQGWLVDDFGDIYGDLKSGLLEIEKGTDEAIEKALWNLKWSFLNHWGDHCINALRYFHYYYYQGKQFL